MKQNDFRGIAVAVVVFALGIIAVGFTGCDFLEDFVRMQGAEEPPTVDFFSGVSTEEEVDSAIDAIRAAAGKDEVSLTLKKGEEPELVQLGEAGRDLPAEGLVLNLDNSPASVTIEGNGQVVDLTGAPLITVGTGVTLTLKNVTFKGLKSGDGGDTDNTRPLVLVNPGGTLIMEAGAVITGNTNLGDASWGTAQYNAGGGVMVSGGTFTMKDGAAISHNTSKQTVVNGRNLGGGGVGVVNGGEFIMEGGTIEDNVAEATASFGGGSSKWGGGGGVMVYAGTFTMKGGTITDNTAAKYSGLISFSENGFGGGVSVNYKIGGRFVKTGGSSIGGNTADYGNQVFVLINYNGGEGVYTYRLINSSPLTGELSMMDETLMLANPEWWDGGNTTAEGDNPWVNPSP